MKATKTKSGKYRVLTSQVINGKRVRKSFTADTKKEAEYQAAVYIRECRQIENDMNFGQAIRAYIESKINVLSPATIMLYETYYKRLEPLHLIKLSRFDSQLVQKYINEIAKIYRPSTTQSTYTFILTVVSTYADNITLRVKVPQVVPKEYSVPTADEVNYLIDNCKNVELKKAIMLGAFCAMRRSEISALLITDLEENTLNINKAYVKNSAYEWVLKTTKTVSSTRKIPIPSFVADYIRENTTGERVVNLTPQQITDRFRKYCIKCKIDTTFHNLRHWSVSHLHATGQISDLYLQNFGGWSSTYTMRKIYVNALSDEQKKVNSEIVNAFERVREKVH